MFSSKFTQKIRNWRIKPRMYYCIIKRISQRLKPRIRIFRPHLALLDRLDHKVERDPTDPLGQMVCPVQPVRLVQLVSPVQPVILDRSVHKELEGQPVQPDQLEMPTRSGHNFLFNTDQILRQEERPIQMAISQGPPIFGIWRMAIRQTHPTQQRGQL